MTADFRPAYETLRLSKLQNYSILDTPAESAYDDIVELAAHICEAPTALVSLIDADRQWFKARIGLDATESSRDAAFCAHTIQQDDVLVVEDTHQSDLFCDNPLVTGAPHIRFYAGAPLITPDGYALGSLCVIDYVPRQIKAHQKQALKILSRQVVAQMELRYQSSQLKSVNASLERRVNERTAGLTAALQKLLVTQNKLRKRKTALRHSALHDPLTGLPNQSYFVQRLEQSIQLANRDQRHLYAVLSIDINDFDSINQSLGHEVGDRILKHVADQIRLMLRKSDLVARLGGDEFAVLLDDIPNAEHAIVAVERIQAQLRQPYKTQGKPLFISTSIGITFSQQGYRQPETAIRDANIAMHRAKQQTKQRTEKLLDAQLKHQNQRQLGPLKSPILIQEDAAPVAGHFVVFDSAFSSQASSARITLEDELRQAFLLDQFELHYQPIFTLFDPHSAAERMDEKPWKSLVGFEVLLRWHHPDRGLLDAQGFIEAVEDIGIIQQICDQTIHRACQELSVWRDRFHQPALKLHINLSLLEIQCPRLLSHWQSALSKYHLPASACRVEITEQVLLSSDPTVYTSLQQLSVLGIDLCIDDFGRGHSSLSRLHQLSISALKVDRTFIEKLSEPSSWDIVKTILDLGHSADMDVIAEGIETAEQIEMLTRLGCHKAQGFWLARPMSAADISAWLAAVSPSPI